MKKNVTTIFEKSQKTQRAYSLPKEEPVWNDFLPNPDLLRKAPLDLPEVSEMDLTRHFSNLAMKSMGIDTHFYPLGSCTMKLNPRVCEDVAALKPFLRSHPLANPSMVEGNLQIIYQLIEKLCQICGMDAGTLAPNAGAQGEFVGIKMIRAYHEHHGESFRNQILVPDSAHGTNPASAYLCGYEVISVKTNPESGDVCLIDLEAKLNEKVAGFMLTNPNTVGIFSKQITQITQKVHRVGGLLYYDGANLNPILNICKPGLMGFDVMHINLHKTFSTPHGGGGPGGAPVLCKSRLQPFLPTPWVKSRENGYEVSWSEPKSIGKIASFYGNFSVLVKAYLYIVLHGHYGLRRIAEMAILNANYLRHHFKTLFKVPFEDYCMHEFVVQADQYLGKGVKVYDIAKRLLDYNIHAPTIYFPLIIRECMLIEPAESESKSTLDHFIEVMKNIIDEIESDPSLIQNAPHQTPIGRLDEVYAAKCPCLTLLPEEPA